MKYKVNKNCKIKIGLLYYYENMIIPEGYNIPKDYIEAGLVVEVKEIKPKIEKNEDVKIKKIKSSKK